MARVYFILGCTAGGKASLGREIARRTGAQIVSVDSMKVYRRMDIGTAKPTAEARAEIPHHCVDVVEPSDSFSVAQYVAHADAAIEQITATGSPVLAVGGTSLYIKALSEGLFEGASSDPDVRQQLVDRADNEGLDAMHAELTRVDPQAAERIHRNDRRRMIRALEVFYVTDRPISAQQKQWGTGSKRYDCVFIGLRRDKADASARINARVKRMIELGLRDEVSALLAEDSPLSMQAAQAVGYAEMIDHLQGGCTLDEAIEHIKINTRRLAKKQRTWHRRWTDVQWFDATPDDTPQSLTARVLQIVTLSGS